MILACPEGARLMSAKDNILTDVFAVESFLSLFNDILKTLEVSSRTVFLPKADKNRSLFGIVWFSINHQSCFARAELRGR